MTNTPLQEDIKQLSQLSTASGIIKRKSPHQFSPIKIAFYPYSSSIQFYQQLQRITQIWQKLLQAACMDVGFIFKVYQQIAQTDPMVHNYIRILKLKKGKIEKDGFTFVRCDYFVNQEGLPKLIEYNLTSVSMSAHSENLQRIKQLSDVANSHKYLENRPNTKFVQEIRQLYQKRNLNGLFVFMVSEYETNIVQQRIIQMKLVQNKIKCKRMTLMQAAKQLRINQDGSLQLGGQGISVVYYRTGYQMTDFQCNQMQCWKAKEIIELSNAIKIPNVTMDLMNQKRMQVELSKQHIYNKYLTKEEANLLQLSLVNEWQFDHLNCVQFQSLLTTIRQNPSEYVLKPNLEGGGHNIYGQAVLEVLQKIDSQQRKKYILMQKIKTNPIQNVLINGSQHHRVKAIYEVSLYGSLGEEEGQLVTNKVVGFLIRIKPQQVNEGGVMAGVGSICSWLIQKQEGDV